MRVSASSLTFEANGSRLLDGVDLDVAGGQLLAIVGPNGAGKSTLLALLAGDLKPAKGVISYDGAEATSVSVRERARSRALLGQHQAEDVAFTVSEVVAMGRFPYRDDPSVGPDEDHRAVDDAIAALDLGGLEHRSVASLSGGERQRVAIARTLAQETPLVLLDEPTTSLDLGHQQMILALVRSLAADGRSVIAVLHDLNMAASFDQVLLLHRGSTVAVGTAESVLTSERLTEVYGCPIEVVSHPLQTGGLVLPAERY